MAFNSSSKKVSNGGLLKVVETKVNCNYSAENDILIDKVLDGFAYASVEQSEKINETLECSGKVNFTSVYTDVEKQIHSSAIQADFSDKIQIPDADAVVVVPKVKAVKQRRETSTFVEATITLELEVYGIIQDTLTFVEATGEDVSSRVKEIETQNLLCHNNTNFEQVEEIELGEEVENLIACYTSFSVNKINPNGNYVTLEGEVVRDLVYTTTGGVIKKQQKRSDVLQEISLLNCTAETNCTSNCYLAQSTADLVLSEDGGKAQVNATAVIVASLWGYETSKFTIVEDLYSVKHELSTSVSSFINYNYLPVAVLHDHFNAVVDMTDKKRIDEVVSLGSIIVRLDRAVIADGALNINGTIVQTILAKNYDNDDVFSTLVELPFSTQINSGAMSDECEVNTSVLARPTTCKNKAGKDLSLTYDLCVLVNGKTYSSEVYVSEVSELGAIAPSESSIIVYMPESDEKVFDIAKKLCVTPDCLLAQNPGVEDGKPIEKVVVYKRNCG